MIYPAGRVKVATRRRIVSTDQWRWTDSKGVQRLLSAEELRSALGDGRLPPDVLVWKRGMPKWLPASDVPELEDVIDDDGPPTITRENEVSLGKRMAPTPSIPPTDLSLSELRNLGPKPAKPDGGWQDGAARRDDDEEETVTEMRHEEEAGTIARRPRGSSRRKSKKQTKRLPVPAAQKKSAPPPPPKRSAPPGPPKRSVPPKRLPSPSKLDIPRPVESSEVLSSAFDSPGRKKPSKPGMPSDKGRDAILSDAGRLVGGDISSVPAGIAPRDKTPFSSAPGPAARPPLGSRPNPSFASKPWDKDADGTQPLDGGLEPIDENQLSSILDDDDGQETSLRVTGASMPQVKAPQTSEPPDTAVLSQDILPIGTSSNAPSSPALPDRLSNIPGTSIGPPRGSVMPLPPAGIGFQVQKRIAAIAGIAALAVMIFAFVLGRVTAPKATSHIGAAIQARTGYSVVPLFARSRTTTPEKPRPCLMLRAPSRLTPGASQKVPFETLVLGEGKLAVGYARARSVPRGILLDPATGAVETLHEPEDALEDDLSRVVPVMMDSEVDFKSTTLTQGDLHEGIFVPGATPFVLGFEGQSLVRRPALDGESSKLWDLGEGPVANMALTARNTPDRTIVAYRHGPEVFVGSLNKAGDVEQPAVMVAGSGGKVGKPSVASNGRDYGVVFADKPKGEGTTIEIRWSHGPVGKPLPEASVVTIPDGGPGGNAIAPSLAALPGGRWLLMWTEGPGGRQTLRAQTYDASYQPLGAALRVSPATGSFGQGMPAVIDDKAVVLFLLASSRSYEVWGTVLQCR